jgi:hypothetical protein
MNGGRQDPASRTTAAVVWWVDFYTRLAPEGTAQARRDELLSDIYEQQAHADERGLPRRAADRAIASRAIRGFAADLSWVKNQHDRKARTMNRTSEPTPGGTRITISLTSLIWTLGALMAATGLATSITEMIDYGGLRFGLVPWPGASNINTTLCILVGSAILLLAVAAKGLINLRRRTDR